MFSRKVLICVVLLKLGLSLVFSAVIIEKNDDTPVTYRLSNESIPSNYFIHLATDIHRNETDFMYSGYVIIDIQIVRDTSVLRLHQRQITVDKVELWHSTTSEVNIYRFLSIADYDFLDILLENELKASDDIYKLKITFTALLRETAQGFYRSYYFDDDNNKHWLAATQFEPTNARYAFPCYDEPGLKSTFELEIKHHKNYTAISNYQGTSNDVDGEYVITKFSKTVKMSTYLLAFIVSDYISNDNLSATPKQSVYTRPNAINQTNLGLEEGVKMIEVLEKYVGIKYSLEKLDQASIPDFQPGAMENWGLVTYKEDLLLFNEDTGTLKQRIDVITTIAHEYGHQFFGNLVSPKWWEYIWLNEGFATLLEYYLPYLLYPTERYMDLFVINRLQYAMTVDGSETTRPMTHYAESPSGISGLFDTIAYHKSGSVLRMFQNVLTEDTFAKGLKLYLDAHEFDIVVPQDLFTALTEANRADLSVPAEFDLTEFLESWTLQKGYPLLTVTRNQKTGAISISQQPFLYKNDGATTNQLWVISFNYFTINGAAAVSAISNWMPKQSEFDVELVLNEAEWIIFNIQQSGYYRVNYDSNNWQLITNYLTKENDALEKINPINRAQLIDDSFNLARAGIIPYEIPLNLIQYLAKELDYIPWAAANANFEYLRNLLLTSKVNVYWNQYINELIKSPLEKIGYTPKLNDTNFDILLRSLLVDWSCKVGNADCLEFVRTARSKYFNMSRDVDANLKEQILCYGLEPIDWSEIAMEILFPERKKDEAEHAIFVNAAGCFESGNFLNLNLILTVLNSTNLRSADRNRIFTSVLSKTELGLDEAIYFVGSQYEEIQVLYSGNKTLNNMVLSMASYVRTTSNADMFERVVLKPLQSIIDDSIIESARNIISERLLWQIVYGVEVKNFLWEYYDVMDEEDPDDGENGDGGNGDGGAYHILISTSLLILLQFIIQLFNY